LQMLTCSSFYAQIRRLDSFDVGSVDLPPQNKYINIYMIDDST
jgi:hypothetical protein